MTLDEWYLSGSEDYAEFSSLVKSELKAAKMDWIDINTERPKQRQDCIVLTDDGHVARAIAHKGWRGGFCQGNGIDGICINGVTHWMKFKAPSA